MQDNELIEILKEFDEKRVEQLNDNARNLFYAIMEIANERDRLLEENKRLKKEIKEYQEELSKADSITQSCIFDGAKESAISYRECLNELDRYKSLYENEKDHTDTLKRIIKKVEHIVINGKLGENLDGTSYYLIHDEIGEKILDLLKEIK